MYTKNAKKIIQTVQRGKDENEQGFVSFSLVLVSPPFCLAVAKLCMPRPQQEKNNTTHVMERGTRLTGKKVETAGFVRRYFSSPHSSTC